MSDKDSTVEFEQVNSKPRLDSAVTPPSLKYSHEY